MTPRTKGAPRQVIALGEKCYVCGKSAIGYVNPYATATAGTEHEPLKPACSQHGSFTRPAMDHRFISSRHGLKVKCGTTEVTTIHWDDLAALRAKPRSAIDTRTIPMQLGDWRE